MKQTYDSLSLVAGANLKRLIKESNYRTQEGFAEAYNTDARCVRRWISGGITKTDQLTEIADFSVSLCLNSSLRTIEMFSPSP